MIWQSIYIRENGPKINVQLNRSEGEWQKKHLGFVVILGVICIYEGALNTLTRRIIIFFV